VTALLSLADRLLLLLSRRATLFLPWSLALGLAFQDLAATLKPLVTPLVIALLGIAMARTDWPAFREVLRRPWLPLAMVGTGMVLIPVLATPALAALPVAPGLALALCLMACLPPLTSMPAVAGFLGLDRAISLFVMLAGTALMPLSVPPLALLLFGLDLKIGVLEFALRLAGLVLGGVALALLLRKLVLEPAPHAAPRIDGLAVVILMVFAIPIMDGVLVRLLNEPWRTAGFVLWGFIATFVYIAAATLLFWPFGAQRACTAGYAAGSRNNALLLAVLPGTVDPDYFLFIAAIQFPIYLTPTLVQPVYRWLIPGEHHCRSAG
jgi:BASS family bile acid:Na+ symporter